jgi:hypothetical protein
MIEKLFSYRISRNMPGPVSITLQDGTPTTVTWSSHWQSNAQQQNYEYPATNLFDPQSYSDYYKDWISKEVYGVQPMMDEEWVQLEFQQPRRVTSYTLVTSVYGNSYNPAQWVLQGSNDGAQWTTIHDQFPSQTQDFNQQAQLTKTFQITSPTMYRFVRLVISKSWITWDNLGVGGPRVSLAGLDLRTTDIPVTTAAPITTTAAPITTTAAPMQLD